MANPLYNTLNNNRNNQFSQIIEQAKQIVDIADSIIDIYKTNVYDFCFF